MYFKSKIFERKRNDVKCKQNQTKKKEKIKKKWDRSNKLHQTVLYRKLIKILSKLKTKKKNNQKSYTAYLFLPPCSRFNSKQKWINGWEFCLKIEQREMLWSEIRWKIAPYVYHFICANTTKINIWTQHTNTDI